MKQITVPVRLLVFLLVCGLLYYHQRYGDLADVAIAYIISQGIVECLQWFMGRKPNSYTPKYKKPMSYNIPTDDAPDVLITGDKLLEIQDK